MKKKISIHGIAKQLNVSATTVSFVLNGKAEDLRIGREVKKRLFHDVLSINYQPKLIAKSLRTGKSRNIDILVEDIAEPFFASIAHGFERKAYKPSCKIFFASTENRTPKARVLLKLFWKSRVDSRIISPPFGVEAGISSFQGNEYAVILLHSYFPDLGTTTLIVNNCAGVYKAMKHLKQNSFLQIVFVTLDSEQTQMNDRLQGYRDTISQSGQKPRMLKVRYSFTSISYAGKIKAFIRKHLNMDAFLFGANYLAFNGLEAINEPRLKIPKDNAVVRIDNSRFVSLYSLAITAVARPVEKIAELITTQLQKLLESPSEARNVVTVVLNATLMIRGSSSKQRKTESLSKKQNAFS